MVVVVTKQSEFSLRSRSPCLLSFLGNTCSETYTPNHNPILADYSGPVLRIVVAVAFVPFLVLVVVKKKQRIDVNLLEPGKAADVDTVRSHGSPVFLGQT